MKLHSRRVTAALTSTVALAAGVVGTVGTGTAQAAGPANGVIAFRSSSGAVQTVKADGSGLRTLTAVPASGSGLLSWSADGSRIGESGYGTVFSVRADNTGEAGIGSGQTVATQDGVFGGNGSTLVSDANGKIYWQMSDGWNWVARLLTDAQEPAGTCDSQPAYSSQGLYAFTRRACDMTTAAAVWTYNPRTGALKQAVPNAAAPVFSADGSTLLYQTSQGGTTQIGASKVDGTGAHLLTADTAGASQPSLSPDGKELAYGSYDGSHGGNVVKLLNLGTQATAELGNGSDPAWQPLRTNRIDHVYGVGGVSNDAAASRWQFNTVGKSAPGLVTAFNAVLVNKTDTIGTALGVELAGEKQAPLLMTSGTSLDPATAAELRRVMRKGWTVYLEGSTATLSAHLAAQVQALGLRVVRDAGNGATDQSLVTARAVTGTPTWVVLADSMDARTVASASALAASAGYHGRIVVLLNSSWSLPAPVAAYLNALSPSRTGLLAVGGRNTYVLQHTTALHQSWRFWGFAGADPEAISVNLARFWWGSPYLVTVATTADWRDGMAGAAVNAGYGPLLWSSPQVLDSVDWGYLTGESAGVNDVQTFGYGFAARTYTLIGDAISTGPGGTQLLQDSNGVPVPGTAGAHTALTRTAAPAAKPAAGPVTTGAGAGVQLLTSGR